MLEINLTAMTLRSFTFGCFQTNTYVLSSDSRILLIDPACAAIKEQQELEQYISSLNPQPSTLNIIATHGHLDHLWGAAWAAEKWHTPVLVPDLDIPMVERMQEQYNLFGIPATAQPFPNEPLSSFIIHHSSLNIISTPGHTPGSVCLYWAEEHLLISGDTLFCCGYGRTDLPGGDAAALFTSLNQLLLLPAETQVYPGHGEPTTIGAERQFYRL